MPATENLLRVDADRIDTVLDLVGELIIARSTLQQVLVDFTRKFGKDPVRARFADALARQSQVMHKLQRSVMKIRMVPVEQLFRRFPRVVRDLAKSQNKDVQLVLQGENTDLDKSILDALAEPLTHLVRNAVDHGIEDPANAGSGQASPPRERSGWTPITRATRLSSRYPTTARASISGGGGKSGAEGHHQCGAGGATERTGCGEPDLRAQPQHRRASHRDFRARRRHGHRARGHQPAEGLDLHPQRRAEPEPPSGCGCR